MTYEEKWRADGHKMPNRGCPCDYGYEEQPKFSRHCARVSCDDCWKREMKEKENGNMKYKVGDTVLVQGKVVEVDERMQDDFHTKVEFPALSNKTSWLADDELFELPKADKTYEQGLQDAWELMRKLRTYEGEQRVTMFNNSDAYGVGWIIDNQTPQEALAKLKAYEEAQTIKVGDVVEYESHKGVVLNIIDEFCSVVKADGLLEAWETCDVKKTGKHVDIAGLLEQIRG